MNKEEILKVQTCVVKVNIHCDGCKQKVKKILQKIDGVFTTKIDSEQGKVTVSGTVDPQQLIRKLAKAGKHAEIWGLKNQLQTDPKTNITTNNKGQKGLSNGNNHPQKGSGQQQLPFTQQQLQQLQQMKGFQDLKLPPQFKDLKMLGSFKDPSQQKAVKFALPPQGDDPMSDDEDDDDDYDDDEYDLDDDDNDFDDGMDDFHQNHRGGGNGNKIMMKPASGGSNGTNAIFNALMNGGNYPQKGGSGVGAVGGSNGKKGSGGGGALPVHIGGGDDKNGSNGVKKGSNQVQGGLVGSKNNGGKNGGGGGMATSNAKNGQKKGGVGGVGGGNAGGRHHSMEKGFQGHGGGFPISQMTGGMPASQGLPSSGVGGQGYFQGSAGLDAGSGGNPYLQQQYLAAMMNQRAAAMVSGGGDPRFHPMMYARLAPEISYMPPYPYPPPHSDPYTHVFSDENTSSCSIM